MVAIPMISRDLTVNLTIYSFVFVSSILLWCSSLLFLPSYPLLHVVNGAGILFHYMYYLYFNFIVLLMYMCYMGFSLIVHYVYLSRMGPEIFINLFIIHLLFVWILYYSRNTQLFLPCWIMIEILIRNLYIVTYMLLSHRHYFLFHEKI